MTLFLAEWWSDAKDYGRSCKNPHTYIHRNDVNHFLALLALFSNNAQNPHWNEDHTVVYIYSCSRQTHNEIGFFAYWKRLLLHFSC